MALWDRNNSKHYQWYFWTSACYILFHQFSLLSYIQHWQYFHFNYKCGKWSEEVPDSCPSQSQRQKDKSQTLAFLFWGQILVSWSCQRQVHKLHLLAQNIVSVPISLLVEFLNNFIYLFFLKRSLWSFCSSYLFTAWEDDVSVPFPLAAQKECAQCTYKPCTQ